MLVIFSPSTKVSQSLFALRHCAARQFNIVLIFSLRLLHILSCKFQGLILTTEEILVKCPSDSID